MTFFDPDKAYLQHTPHYKLPYGRLWPLDGVPGASGIGPLYEAEYSKFGVIDFQMRGAARAFGNGVNYVSGIISEGEYGQFVYQDKVTVENTGFQGLLNDAVIGDPEDGISWVSLDVNQDNYLFVKTVEQARSIGAYKSSLRNNDLETFAQNNPEHPDQRSMLVAYRPSGAGSLIQTDLQQKVYVNLADHITKKNPHGDPWMQSGTIISSGIIAQGQVFAAGNMNVKSGLQVSEQTTLNSAGGFIWPDAIFQNDVLVRGRIDFADNANAEQLSGTELIAGQVHLTYERYGAPYSSGALAGPGAAPLASGANVASYNFGDIHQSGNIVFPNAASVIDGVRPELNGLLLNSHIAGQNPHALTPVRLSGVGRLGVGDPNQWGPHPNSPPSDSPYWRMQGNWPVSSGISLDGIDMSVTQKFIDGTVADKQATAKSVGLSGLSVYRFEETSGSVFRDGLSNFNLDEINGVSYQQSSVNASFGFSALANSGTVVSLKGDRPLPSNKKESFTFAGWFNGSLVPPTQSGVTLAQHTDQDGRGWALIKEAFGSGIRLDMQSQKDGGKASVRNTLSAFNGGAWNHIAAVYDGVNIHVGVNGVVQSGAGALNGWADGVAEGGDQQFSLLAPPSNLLYEGEKEMYSASFVVADLSSGQFTFASLFGGPEPIYSIYEEIAAGVFKLRRDTVLIDDGSSNFTVQEPDPAKRYAGKVVYTSATGSTGKTKEAISSGIAGWTDLNNGQFAHGLLLGSGVTSILENFFVSDDGVTYSGISADFISDGNATTWMRSGIAVYKASRGIISAGIRGAIGVDAKDFSSLDFVSSGAGGYEYIYNHPYKSNDLIVDVYKRQRQPKSVFSPAPASTADVIISPLDNVDVLVDINQIKIQVPDAASRFRGKLVVGDGREHVGGQFSLARVDDVVYEVGKAWPQYQQNYVTPIEPFISGVHAANPSDSYHKHLLLPPEGEFISIAPEYPGMVLSGNSPGTFESSRAINRNWYDWYAYSEEDVIIFTRLPIPAGVTKLASLKIDARTSSPQADGVTKMQVRVLDSDDAVVTSIPSHWLHPLAPGSEFLFSGGGIGSDLGGNFEGGKKFEVQIRMRAVSGFGIHLGPMVARFM